MSRRVDRVIQNPSGFGVFSPKTDWMFLGFYLNPCHLGEIFVQSLTFGWEGIILAVFHKIVPLSSGTLKGFKGSNPLKENDWRMKIRSNNIEQIWASENVRNFKI